MVRHSRTTASEPFSDMACRTTSAIRSFERDDDIGITHPGWHARRLPQFQNGLYRKEIRSPRRQDRSLLLHGDVGGENFVRRGEMEMETQ